MDRFSIPWQYSCSTPFKLYHQRTIRFTLVSTPTRDFFFVVPLFDFLYYLFKPGFWHWIFFPYCSLLIKQTYIFTYIFSWLKQMRIAIRFVFRILRQIMTTRMGLEKWWLSAKKTGAGRRNPPEYYLYSRWEGSRMWFSGNLHFTIGQNIPNLKFTSLIHKKSGLW